MNSKTFSLVEDNAKNDRNEVKLLFFNSKKQYIGNSVVIKVYFYQLIFFLQKVHLKPPRCTFILQTFDEIKYDLGHNRFVNKDIESISHNHKGTIHKITFTKLLEERVMKEGKSHFCMKKKTTKHPRPWGQKISFFPSNIIQHL